MMVAVTYGVARVPAAQSDGLAQAAAPREGVFARFFDALMESRLQQARREIARHAHLLPHVRDEHGNIVSTFNIDEMPFGGW